MSHVWSFLELKCYWYWCLNSPQWKVAQYRMLTDSAFKFNDYITWYFSKQLDCLLNWNELPFNQTCSTSSKLCNCLLLVIGWYQGAVSIRKTVLPGMAIPMLKIRRPNGRLIFNMEIAIRRLDGLYIETGPSQFYSYLLGLLHGHQDNHVIAPVPVK